MNGDTAEIEVYAHRRVDRAVKAVANFNASAPCVCRLLDAATGEFLGWGYETGEIVAGPNGEDLPRSDWVRYRVVEYDCPFED